MRKPSKRTARRAPSKRVKNTPRVRVEVPRSRRSSAYSAASVNRITEDWKPQVLSANSAIGTGLQNLRARSRVLERENSYAKGFAKALRRNVLGSEGIKLQMMARNPGGQLDKYANDLIEEAWRDWCQEKLCDVTREQDWKGLCNIILQRIAYDGEIEIEYIDDGGGDNPYGLALKLYEADHLDEYMNLDGGSTRIRMSVEVNEHDRVLAYHLLTNHPGEHFPQVRQGARHRRVVSVSRMLHPFLKERPGQFRGVPWLHAAMSDMNMLHGYKEAELVAARVSAAKAGFFEQTTPDGYAGREDEDGNPQMEIEPGIFETLPMGLTFKPWDPSHPNTAFGDFVKGALRSIATGMGMSYNTLSSDLEGVNYSSIRAGLLDEREEWMELQGWFVSQVCRPIFRFWLERSLDLGAIKLPSSRLSKYKADTWRGRRWKWVDPEKDVRAALLAVEGGLTSRRSIVAESGADDYEDVIEQTAEDNKLAAEKGVMLQGSNGNPIVVAMPAKADPQDTDEDDGADPEQPAVAQPATQPAAAGTAPAGQDVQSTALNGAQVAALQQIVQAVADKLLPADAAIGMIEISFPDIDRPTIQKIIAAAQAHTPPKPDPEPEPGGPVAKPDEEKESPDA